MYKTLFMVKKIFKKKGKFWSLKNTKKDTIYGGLTNRGTQGGTRIEHKMGI